MIGTCLTSVADYIKEHGKKSCRKLAGIFNRSKSSIHRRQQKIKSRAHIPGALFFESSDGQAWLKKLVVAAILIFGIKSGVGSETLALFFSMITVGSFVATSPASLKRLEDRIDDLIIEYKDMQDKGIMEKAPELSITPGGDETFFEKMMMLVCMDLNSGFIFNESIEQNRNHSTWESSSTPWLSRFKIVRCFLSDKARALLKLAKDSLGVDRLPDLFHMMNDVSKVMRFSFHRLKTSTEKSLADATTKLAKGVDEATNKVIIASLSIRMQLISRRQVEYEKSLRRLSTALHPFAILSGEKQNSATVESNMLANLNRIKEIKEELEINDSGNKLDRVKRQIPDASRQVDMWWGWVHTSLESSNATTEIKTWLLDYLLPFIYWRCMLRKANSKKIKRFYQVSLMLAEIKLRSHELTDQLLIPDHKSEWQLWAEEMSQLFIRTTSAIEGRNGWLSQIHFNGRGLSVKRIKSQTAIHNYFLKRPDGTTACERLSQIKPDDMFEFILQRIGPMAQPGNGKSRGCCNALNLKSVPA